MLPAIVGIVALSFSLYLLSMFVLHPQLEKDTVVVGDLPLCRVLLHAQYSQYPWLILVPRRTGCRDLTDLPDVDYHPVLDELRYVHDAFRDWTGAHKMNVAALGNVVPQLHFHIIARFNTDEAWPRPVFTIGEPRPYPDGGTEMVKKLRKILDLGEQDS